MPSVPFANVEEVIVRWLEAMLMNVRTDFVSTGLLLSLAVTVKLKIPLAVGIPEITPVAVANVRPAGRVPAVMDQMWDDVPPLAASFAP
jgi:hypothetical protein